MTVWSKSSGIDTGWTKPAGISSAIETDNLLTESGVDLLTESENNILAEFWSGFRKIVGVINTIWQ